MLKKLFNFFLLLFISLFFFLISDYFISKHTNLFHIKKDCFKYLRFKNNDKEYYSYELEKNCYAFENKGTTFAYKVVTNNLGHRIANKNLEKDLEKDLEKEKIIFLGDSFTYGFGINYKDSIPGQIDKKTNNKFEVINFAMPGYSPSINLYKLEEYLKNSKKLKIKKIFYVMDLSDVHDESNRWSNIKNINLPVIIDENIKKEIKDTFEFKQNFRTSKFLSSLVNNNVRNFRKKIKFYFSKNKVVNSLDVKTFWGKFTYTSTSNLANDVEYRKLWPVDYKIGIQNIQKKIKKISDLIKPYNTEFYIVIHPWKETLEYGQEEFNWEFFANEICILTNCNKVISLFDDIRDLKRENILWKSEIYFKKDVHFNKEGNDLYSNRIYFDAFN